MKNPMKNPQLAAWSTGAPGGSSPLRIASLIRSAACFATPLRETGPIEKVDMSEC